MNREGLLNPPTVFCASTAGAAAIAMKNAAANQKSANDFRVMPFHSLFDTKRKGRVHAECRIAKQMAGHTVGRGATSRCSAVCVCARRKCVVPAAKKPTNHA